MSKNIKNSLNNSENRKRKVDKTSPFSKSYSRVVRSNSNQRPSTKRAKSVKADHSHRKNQLTNENIKPPVRIFFLGGINEVGKNMTVFECEGEMVIVDCGLAFPDETMPGIDLVIPDFTFVEENREKIKGIVITHGHEDHIGGLAYLLIKLRVPVYGTKLTVGLISGKLEEHGIAGRVKLETANPGDIIRLGSFTVEFIHVNHSIPDAVGFAIKCAGGTIVHTGDFKIDSTPIDGGMIDLPRFGELGNEGVLCMLSDSTNAERQGFTESERKVGESFELLFAKAKNKRIIVATFASNIHRVQQIINVANSLGRKVALSGRSLENVVEISRNLGYLNIPSNTLISLDEIKQYPQSKLVIITTGSQGEPMSALTRMSRSEHKMVKVSGEDYIIISATPIPGNEKTVSRVINELLQLGADVVYEKMYDVHVSGHACREELKIMLGIIKPKYFIPVHGEKKHLVKHAELAEIVGIPSENVAIVENGSAIELSEKEMKVLDPVPSGQVLVDGTSVGDVGNAVVNDRKRLGQNGIVIVSFAYDFAGGVIASYPEIETRGFVYLKESEELIEEAKKVVSDTIDGINRRSKSIIKNSVRDAVSSFMTEKTGRSPIILIIIVEVY